MSLSPIRDEATLARLVDEAPHRPRGELDAVVRAHVQQAPYCVDDGRLADVDRKLALVRTVTDVGHAHLRRIKARVDALLAEASASAHDDSGQDPQA